MHALRNIASKILKKTQKLTPVESRSMKVPPAMSLTIPSPLPTDCPTPHPQSWHEYDAERRRWVAIDLTAGNDSQTMPSSATPGPESTDADADTDTPTTSTTPTAPTATTTTSQATTTTSAQAQRPLVLTTWNVDAFGELPQSRIISIMKHIREGKPSSDIIFLQEVSRQALQRILQDEWTQRGWISSERDETSWGFQSFATMTLLSKERFGRAGLNAGEGWMEKIGLGPVWRVQFKSRFMRDGLCCDVFVPFSGSSPASGAGAGAEAASSSMPEPGTETGLKPGMGMEMGHKRLRLINVHLDSLPISPSYRPNQLSTCASLLRSAGRGLIAGDFNPVLPEDATLLEENNLIDAWEELRSGEDGFTWGVDGKQQFPPARLDKVAIMGIQPKEIETLESGKTKIERLKKRGLNMEEDEPVETGEAKKEMEVEVVDTGLPWSDHYGLRYSFSLE